MPPRHTSRATVPHHCCIVCGRAADEPGSRGRTVFERRAPKSVARIESAIAPVPLGQGKTVKTVDASVLDSLSVAYQEARDETSTTESRIR